MKDLSLNNVQNELVTLYNELNNIGNLYIEKAKELENQKLEILDFSIRDAIDKQVMKASQENPSFASLVSEVEELRRKRDFLYKKIDVMKTLAYTLKPKD